MNKSFQKSYQLKDICSEITVGFVGAMTKEYVETGVPLLRSLNIKPYWLNLDDIKYISKKFHQKISKSALREDDVVIVRTGQPGTSCVIPSGYNELNCSDLVIARPDKKKILPHFLSFYFNSMAKQYVGNQLVGAIQQHFNIGSAKEMIIKLPDLEVQDNIVKVLHGLNQKIELNNKINAELEAMAKLIYDYWFVQFDFPNENGKPYKSSGGKMVWNEELKREIPEGWEDSSILNIEKNIITGKTPTKTRPDYFNGNIPFITIGDIRGNTFVINTEETLSSSGAESQKKKYLEKGSICVTCIASPGLVGFAAKKSQTNQQINSIICSKEYNRFYLYFSIKDYFQVAKAKSGNTFANMNKSDFESIPLVKPSKEILEKYHECISSFFDEIFTKSIENNNLKNLRDWLLPMLMNGQVTVENTKKNPITSKVAEPAASYVS